MSNITPPPELVQQWNMEGRHQDYCTLTESIAARAAQWGADVELKACCAWLDSYHAIGHSPVVAQLRAWRRPKPPSLKEQALAALGRYMIGETILTKDSLDTIHRALEALPDD